jgi:hypothetical protein
MEEEDNWENISITDLLVSIDNKERERKILEQRKQVEDADIKLSEELFSVEPESREIKEILERPIPISIKKETKKKNKVFLEKRQEEIRKKQIEASQKKREQNKIQMRAKEIYGEAINDNDYDYNNYISIEDKYC